MAASMAGLRVMATMVHAMPVGVGELRWEDGGPPVVVGPGSGRDICPCHFRASVRHAVARGSADVLSHQFGRSGAPTARLVPGQACEALGAGIYRFTLPCRVLDVFATTLDADAARQAVASASIPQVLRAGPGRPEPSTGPSWSDAGLFSDELMEVGLVWMGRPPTITDDARALDAVLAMAGACAAAEAELGV